MNWAVWLVAGVVVGYVVPGRASRAARTPASVVGAVVVGVAGGAGGGWLASRLGLGNATSWLGALVVAGGGAVLVLSAWHGREERRRK